MFQFAKTGTILPDGQLTGCGLLHGFAGTCAQIRQASGNVLKWRDIFDQVATMGMFDIVKVCLDLPVKTPEMDWQSKDTPAQNLETYTLGPDGKLWLLRHHFVRKPCAPKPPAGILDRLDWSSLWQQRIDDPPLFCRDYSGALHFYGIEEPDPPGRWWQFCAVVRDGLILEIVPLKVHTKP